MRGHAAVGQNLTVFPENGRGDRMRSNHVQLISKQKHDLCPCYNIDLLWIWIWRACLMLMPLQKEGRGHHLSNGTFLTSESFT